MNYSQTTLVEPTHAAPPPPPPHFEAEMEDGHRLHPRPRSHSLPGQPRISDDHTRTFRALPQHVEDFGCRGRGGRGRGGRGRGGGGRGVGRHFGMRGRHSDDEHRHNIRSHHRDAPIDHPHHHHHVPTYEETRHEERPCGKHDHFDEHFDPRSGPMHHHGGSHSPGCGAEPHRGGRGGFHSGRGRHHHDRHHHQHDHHCGGRGRSKEKSRPPPVDVEIDSSGQTSSDTDDGSSSSESSTISAHSRGPADRRRSKKVRLYDVTSLGRELDAIARRLAHLMRAGRGSDGKTRCESPPHHRHHRQHPDHHRHHHHHHEDGHQRHGPRHGSPHRHGRSHRRRGGPGPSHSRSSPSEHMRRKPQHHHHHGHHRHDVHFGPPLSG